MVEENIKRVIDKTQHHDTTTGMPPLATNRNMQLNTTPPTQDGTFNKEMVSLHCRP
jgi:hypothetical protein